MTIIIVALRESRERERERERERDESCMRNLW